MVIKGAVRRLCACAVSWFLVRRTVFQVFARGRKSLSIVPFRWENIVETLDVDAGRFVGRFTMKAARVESCFRLEAGLYPKEERKRQKKKQWDEDQKRTSVAREVRESWKNIKCMCVYSSDFAFAQHLFCLWRCEEERGSYLFCQDILDLPFQLLSSRY